MRSKFLINMTPNFEFEKLRLSEQEKATIKKLA